MKNMFIFAAMVVGALGVQATESDKLPVTQTHVADEVTTITVNVKSDGNPVVGALIKVVYERTTVGSGTTDASGNASVAIKTTTVNW